MKTIAVHSPQGGSGKTTLAKSLSALGYGYSSIDPTDLVSGQHCHGVLIVDTSPHWSKETIEAVVTADALVIPVMSAAPWALIDLKSRLSQVLAICAEKKIIVVCTDVSDAAQSVMKFIQPILGPGVTAFPKVISVTDGSCDKALAAQLASLLI